MPLDKYMNMQNMQNSQNMEDSPISRGVLQGMEAARRAMELTEQQKRMASAALWAQIAKGLSNPSKNYGGGTFEGFARLNDSLNTGIQSYQDQLNAQKEINAKLLNIAIQNERYQQMQALRNAQLQERRDYHKSMHDYKINNEKPHKPTSQLRFQEVLRHHNNDLVRLKNMKEQELAKKLKSNPTFDEDEIKRYRDEIDKKYSENEANIRYNIESTKAIMPQNIANPAPSTKNSGHVDITKPIVNKPVSVKSVNPSDYSLEEIEAALANKG